MVKTRSGWLLFAALLLCSAGFQQPVEYDNTKSRWMMLAAMVDEGRLAIDTYQKYTVDKSWSGGHYYSNKAMGLPMLAAPAYWLLLRAVPCPYPGAALFADPWYRFAVTAVLVGLPFALLGLMLFRLLCEMGTAPRRALWAVLSWGFGTIALNHATIFSGHQTAAGLGFCAFAILWRLRRGGRGPRGELALSFLAGFCAGGAVLCDYLAFFVAVPIAVYALTSRLPRAAKGAFTAAAALCASALALYNRLCFGSFGTVSYARLDSTHVFQDRFHGFGFLARPDPMILPLLLGSLAKGLFFISPVLLFAVPGLVLMWRKAQCRKEAMVILAAALSLLAFLTCHEGWHSGSGFGVRYFVVLLPFLTLPMAQAIDGGPLFAALLALSVVQVACAQLGCPHTSPEIQNPVVEFMVPLMLKGVVSLNWLGSTKLVGYFAGGVIQYAAAAGLAAVALRGLPRVEGPRLARHWKAFMSCWAVYILLMLALFRTQSDNVVRWHRALALHEDAVMLRSTDLERKARQEMSGDSSSGAGSPSMEVQWGL